MKLLLQDKVRSSQLQLKLYYGMSKTLGLILCMLFCKSCIPAVVYIWVKMQA